MPPFPLDNSEDISNDAREEFVVDHSHEKETVYNIGKDFGNSHERETVMTTVDEKMKDAVVALSKAWRPFNMPLSR